LTEPTQEPFALTPRHRLWWMGFGLVLLVGVVADLANAVSSWFQPAEFGGLASFWDDFFWLAQRSLVVTAVVLYVIVSSRERRSAFGIVRFRWRRDLSWAVAALLGALATDALVAYVFGLGGIFFGWGELAFGLDTASGWMLVPLALVYVANSVAEEITVRSFLQTRLLQLFASPLWAILASAALFASYHAYQGGLGLATAFTTGIVFGAVFHRTRTVWPVILAHTALNIVYSPPFYTLFLPA
jgi:membrane protease YdiL (CAAX protease family)